jgi:hypothetical protein
MQYLALKLHFFKILIAYLVNTFEMMDDLTCLMMKLFFKNNNKYDNILPSTSLTFTCLSLFDFQKELLQPPT